MHPDGVLDQHSYIFGHTLDSFKRYIEEGEKQARFHEVYKLYNLEKKPFLRMVDLARCGQNRCSRCGNPIIECHDIVFGIGCVYKALYTM